MKKMFSMIALTGLFLATLGLSAAGSGVTTNSSFVWSAVSHPGNGDPGVFQTGSATVEKWDGDEIVLSSQPNALASWGADDNISVQVNGGSWTMIQYFLPPDMIYPVPNVGDLLRVGENTLNFQASNTGGPYCVSTLYVLRLKTERLPPMNPDPDHANTKDPINTINGNMSLHHTDLAISCPGIPLSFERFYNSRELYEPEATGLQAGWRHTYSWSIRGPSDNTLTGADAPGDRSVRTATGETFEFERTPSGRYISLYENPYELRSGSGGRYELSPRAPTTSRRVFSSTTGVSVAVGPAECLRPTNDGGYSATPMKWKLGTGSWMDNGSFLGMSNGTYRISFNYNNDTGPWWYPYPENAVLKHGRIFHTVYLFGLATNVLSSNLASAASVCVDTQGRVCMSDNGRTYAPVLAAAVVRYNPTNAVWERFTNASISSPRGIDTDPNDNIYVANYGNNSILKRATNGVWTTLSKGSGNGVGYMNHPSDLDFGPDNRLYVADTDNKRIQVCAPATTSWTVFVQFGSATTAVSVAVDSNRVYAIGAISSPAQNHLLVYSTNGTLLEKYILSTNGPSAPRGAVTLLCKNGQLYTVDKTNQSVHVCDRAAGLWNWRVLMDNTVTNTVSLPVDFAVGADDTLYAIHNLGLKRFYPASTSKETDWNMTLSTNGTLCRIADNFGNAVALSNITLTSTSYITRVQHSNGQKLDMVCHTDNGGYIQRVETSSTNLYLTCDFGTPFGNLAEVTRVVDGVPGSSYYGYKYTPYLSALVEDYYNARDDHFWYEYYSDLGNDWAWRMNAYGGYYEHEVTYPYGAATVSYGRDGTNQDFAYSLSGSGNVIGGVTGPDGTQKQTTYVRDVWANVCTTIVSNASIGQTGILATTYNALGYVTDVAMGLNATPTNWWHVDWDTGRGLANYVTSPFDNVTLNNHVTRFEYDRRQVSAIKVQWGDAATNTYDTRLGYTTNGLLAAVTNANGHWVRLSYDSKGGLSGIQPQTGPSTTLSNSSLGYLERVTMPGPSGDRVTFFENDSMGRVKRVLYPDNSEERVVYDLVGNPTNMIDVGGRVTSLEWAPAHNLSAVIRHLPEGGARTNAVAYDQQFNTLRLTDALARPVETYALDIEDRPVAITNLEGQTMTVQYGIEDYVMKTVRFDGSIVSNRYDTDGNISKTFFPDCTNTFRWYAAGELRSISNNAGAVTFAYDKAARITNTIGCGPAASAVYVYDPAGQVTNVTTAVGSRRCGYDAAERVTNLVSEAGTFSWGYDQYNGLASTLSLGTNLQAVYGFDVCDRLTSLVWRVNGQTIRGFAHTYNSTGGIETVRREDGSWTRYQYDGVDQLTNETRYAANGAVLSSVGYQYDAVGNRTGKTVGDMQIVYTLPYGSSGNRMTDWRVVSPQSPKAPTYVAGTSTEPIGTDDLFGTLMVSNGTSVVKPTIDGTNFFVQGFAVNVGTQQIVAAIRDQAGNTTWTTTTVFQTVVTNAVYSYNTVGCVTNIRHSGYQYQWDLRLNWDGQYQLTEALTNGVSLEKYGYDPVGRCIYTVNGSVTNWHVYSGMQLMADVNSTGGVIRSYTWGPGYGNLLATTVYTGTTAKTYFILSDHQRSVHAIADSAGTIVESYQYDSWGRLLSIQDTNGKALTQSAIGNRVLWQGKEYSWATGLYFNGARIYDSVCGRFLSKDPSGIAGGLNEYLYAENDPVNNFDPDGMDLLDSASNFAAGMGDNLSFGLTSGFRKLAGYDSIVDRSGGTYSAGKWTGTAVGLAMGGAHAGRNIIAQMGSQGSLLTRLGRGTGRFFWDNRTWGSVRSTWSQSMGGLRDKAQSLHHWLSPQVAGWVQGFRNAGFNYVTISARWNSIMNGRTMTARTVERLFRTGMFTELSPLWNGLIATFFCE